MKDAKSEAQKEIEEYKKRKEEEFKKFEAEVRIRGPFIGHCPVDDTTAQAGKQESRGRCQRGCRGKGEGD